MPCNTRITATAELNIKTDPKVLAAALQAEYGPSVEALSPTRFRFSGAGGVVYLTDGTLSSRELSERQLGEVSNRVKQSYAVSAMKAASQRFGWAMSEKKAAPTVTRRA